MTRASDESCISAPVRHESLMKLLELYRPGPEPKLTD